MSHNDPPSLGSSACYVVAGSDKVPKRVKEMPINY